jgi:prephenate dehydrogenase
MTEPPFPLRLVIVGFGLIGGSLALASRRRGLARHVVGIDRPAVLAAQPARAIADELIDAGAPERVNNALRQADLVVLATPVAAIEASMTAVLEVAALVTDCGSTKRRIVRAAERSSRRPHFVAGHPMAGRPQSGVAAAVADLFEGRPWILCPEGSAREAVDIVARLAAGVGARVHELDAAEHDRVVSLTSHVPQLLASVLAVLATERNAWVAAGPAFDSATRVAGGPEEIWRDIFATNADEVAATLREISSRLDDVASSLEAPAADVRAVLHLLELARLARQGREPR